MASNNIELSHLVPTVTQRVTSKDAKDSFVVSNCGKHKIGPGSKKFSYGA